MSGQKSKLVVSEKIVSAVGSGVKVTAITLNQSIREALTTHGVKLPSTTVARPTKTGGNRD